MLSIYIWKIVLGTHVENFLLEKEAEVDEEKLEKSILENKENQATEISIEKKEKSSHGDDKEIENFSNCIVPSDLKSINLLSLIFYVYIFHRMQESVKLFISISLLPSKKIKFFAPQSNYSLFHTIKLKVKSSSTRGESCSTGRKLNLNIKFIVELEC